MVALGGCVVDTARVLMTLIPEVFRDRAELAAENLAERQSAPITRGSGRPIAGRARGPAF